MLAKLYLKLTINKFLNYKIFKINNDISEKYYSKNSLKKIII